MNISLIDQAARCAEYFLAPLGDRWLHVQGVAEKAYQIRQMFGVEDATCLIAAAYLHDLGYAPALACTGFHPLDGAFYVCSLGYRRLASLVAHHSEARYEARLRGLEEQLYTFAREYSAVADALTYCDQTTGPTGQTVSFEQRVTEVFARYGETSPVSQALCQALPSLTHAVERTESRIRRYGIEIALIQ